MNQHLRDDQLERYSRHILLPQIDIAGQQQLLNSTVLIIGMGGLGSPSAMYLAASGIGNLVLCDFDKVEMSNLQRQIAHHTNAIGKPKVESARDTLLALNPEISITTIARALDDDDLTAQVRKADVVIDASDNFDTRYAVNQACVYTGTPLVSGAAIRLQGQVAVFNRHKDSPCYRCLYPEIPLANASSCSDAGILAPLVGIIGSIMATEALKLLIGIGKCLDGQLALLDAESMSWRSLRLQRDPDCPVCSAGKQRKSVL